MNVYETLYIALFKKTPCKTCIVKPICRFKCDKLKKHNYALGNSPFLTRASAWLLIFAIFVEIPWIIVGMLK